MYKTRRYTVTVPPGARVLRRPATKGMWCVPLRRWGRQCPEQEALEKRLRTRAGVCRRCPTRGPSGTSAASFAPGGLRRMRVDHRRKFPGLVDAAWTTGGECAPARVPLGPEEWGERGYPLVSIKKRLEQNGLAVLEAVAGGSTFLFALSVCSCNRHLFSTWRKSASGSVLPA